jgi:hypothetical protein
MEPRKEYSCGQQDIPQRGESRRFPVAGRQQSRARHGEGPGHPRGLRTGQALIRGTRERGRATCLRVTLPEKGTGRPKALAWAGGFAPTTSPHGTPQTHRSRQGSRARATSEVPRNGLCGSLSRASYLGRWGREAQTTHGREGDAGHHVELKGKTGDPWRSPTVTTKLRRLAEQAARDPERVFSTLAHLIDEDFLREAYRPTSKSRAAGIDGVTAKQ